MRISCLVLLFVFSVYPSQSWAQQCKRVSIAGSSIWYPYAYVDHKQQSLGIGFDIVESILQEMKQEYEVLLFLPWKRIQHNLNSGRLDILVSNHWSAEREKNWNLTSEIGREDLLVFSLKKNAFVVEGWLSLVGKEGIVARGTSLGADYEQHKKYLSLIEIGGHENGFEMLNKGFVDYLLLTRSAAAPFLRDDANRNIVAASTVLNSYSIRMSFSKTSPCSHLYAKFEQLLQQRIAQGWLEKLREDYTHLVPVKYSIVK